MRSLSELTIFIGTMFLVGGIIQPASAGTNLCGGWSEAFITNDWVTSAANFAIKAQEQVMSKENPVKPVSLSLTEIVQAKQQVVAGMNYGLRLKVKCDGVAREAEVIVWRKLNGEYVLTSWVWK